MNAGVDGNGKRSADAAFTNSSTPRSWAQLKHPAPANGSMQPPSLPTGQARPNATSAAAPNTWLARSTSMPQIVYSSHHPSSRAAATPAPASSFPEQYPSHLGIGGVGDYFSAAAAAASGLGPHTRLVRSSSTSSLHGGGNGQADQASDASSPTSRASLALIKLSNSSEAVKALSYVGNTDVDDEGNREEAMEAGEAGQHGVEGIAEISMAGGNEGRAGAEQANGRKRKAPSGHKGASHNGAAGGSEDPNSRPAKSRKGSNITQTQQQQHHHHGHALATGFGLSPALLSNKAKKSRDWRDFEPVRQKIVKASEAKYLFK